MSEFINYIKSFSPLSGDATKDLSEKLKTKSFKKNEIINPVGTICPHLFFINSGLVKHYYYYNDNQYILGFFYENKFFVITDSFFNNAPAEYFTQALEDTILTCLEHEALEDLCRKHHSFESFIRKLSNEISISILGKYKSMLYLDATERYKNFLKQYPHLQQRISLGDTASFLGISQVYLSRIRSKK